MKKNIGKVYKRLSFALGGFGGVGSLIIAILRSTSIIASSNLNNIKINSFFHYLLVYWFCIFFVCLILYGIGHIIELLQKNQ